MRMTRLRGALAIGLVVCASACAENRTMVLPAAPPDLFDKTTAVAINPSSAVISKHGHIIAGAGEGAAKGALSGGVGALAGGVQMGGIGVLVGVALAPVFIAGGGIAGGVAAHPVAETEAAIAAIEDLYADEEILLDIAGKVSARVEAAGFDEVVSCVTETAVEPICTQDGVNRLALVSRYAFSTVGEYSPVLRFGIEVHAIANPADEAATPMKFRWSYLSGGLDFFEATANEASGLRSALTRAHADLARHIVDDLFVYRTPSRVTGQYYTYTDPPRFAPEAFTPGVVTRLPLEADLVSPPPERLAP